MQAPDAREPQLFPIPHSSEHGTRRIFRHLTDIKSAITNSGLDYPLLLTTGVLGAVAVTAGLQELQIMAAHKVAPSAVGILEQYKNINLALSSLGGYVATRELYRHFRS